MYRKLLTEFVTKFIKESLIKRVMDIVRNSLATETEPARFYKIVRKVIFYIY